MVGGELTLADVMVVGVLQVATRFVMDREMVALVPMVVRYMKEILEVKEMKEAFGEPVFCETRVKGE